MKKYWEKASTQIRGLTAGEWIVSICTLTVYLIQFVLVPRLFSRYYPQSNEATAILLLPLLVLILAGSFLGVRLRGWLLTDSVYALALILYNGRGLYGIGLRGVRLDGMIPVYDGKLALLMVGAVVAAMVILQLLLTGLLRLLRFLPRK